MLGLHRVRHPHSRQQLQELADTFHDVRIIRECADERDAVDALATLEIDLVFFALELQQAYGFGLLTTTGTRRSPSVIFTSTHAELAVRAFEVCAVDYLLKPYNDARFAIALERARQQIEGDQRAVSNRLRFDHAPRPTAFTYPDAIALRTGAQYAVLRVADIDWIEADGNYAKVYIDRRARLLTKTLAILERDVLDPSIFVRVHRSAIVNSLEDRGCRTPHTWRADARVSQDG